MQGNDGSSDEKGPRETVEDNTPYIATRENQHLPVKVIAMKTVSDLTQLQHNV